MIPLIRFYLRLAHWKLLLALNLLILLAIVGNELSDRTAFIDDNSGREFQLPPGQYPGPDSPPWHYAPEPPLKRFFESSGFVIFPIILILTIIAYRFAFDDMNLSLPISRPRLLAARVTTMLLFLWLSLLWFIPLGVMLARSTSSSERLSIAFPLVNIWFFMIPIAVLAAWISPWLSLARSTLLSAFLIFLPFALAAAPVALCIAYDDIGLFPAAIALGLAAILYHFALRTFSRLELAPASAMPESQACLSNLTPAPAVPVPQPPSAVNRHLLLLARSAICNRLDRLSPLNRAFAAALWTHPLYLLVVPSVVGATFAVAWQALVAGPGEVQLVMTFFWPFVVVGNFPLVMKRLQPLLVFPVPRRAIFLRIFAPFLILLLFLNALALVIVPFTVRNARLVDSHDDFVEIRWGNSYLGGTPQDLAQRLCYRINSSFSVNLTPADIITTRAGLSTIDLAPVLWRLRLARLRLALLAAILTILGVTAVLWLPLRSRRSLRSPIRIRLFPWLFLVLFALLIAAWLLPLAFHALDYDRYLRSFLIHHFYLFAPLLLLVSILLWLRHLRAFRYLELPTTRTTS